MKLAQFLGLAAFVALAACSRQDAGSHATDVTGALPALDFTMMRANDGREVQGSDYAGKVAILYFGYTHCPDICPTTLSDLADALRKLGPQADEVRVLFVTVDPNRDTLDVMKGYVASFAPQIDGLRGTPDELTALTRRYRIAFSVTPGPPYEVMHSNAVFFFDKAGRARLVSTDVSRPDEVAADLKKVLGQ
ncbi:MAG TPA: SCO family protein [Rhizomicrobium sp.]|nr:SCO family protein [Rhizomicrobium sp.]